MLLRQQKQSGVNVCALIEKIMTLCTQRSARYGKQKTTMVFIRDPLLPTHIMLDGEKLFLILLELVANAIKYTERGIITIQIKSQCQPSKILQCSVSDTGIGILPDQKTAIFKRHCRISQDKPGAGLGLSIISKLLKEMQGEIRVESKPNVGSTFTCFIPFAHCDLNDENKNDDVCISLNSYIQTDKKNIETALRKKKWSQLADANHRLLGAVVYCDMPELENACRALQYALIKSIFNHADIKKIQKLTNTILQLIQKLPLLNDF